MHPKQISIRIQNILLFALDAAGVCRKLSKNVNTSRPAAKSERVGHNAHEGPMAKMGIVKL
jgi:hypothetical protein